MTPDEILTSLFPAGHSVRRGAFGTLHGRGRSSDSDVAVIGITGGTPLGVDCAILLASHVLEAIEQGRRDPILVLIDAGSQNMTRRDELLGLPEYLAHLAKVLKLAAAVGHRTVSLLYGSAEGGAFIATALSTQLLATLEGASPSVMDLPSIARVTKLSLENLQELAKSTPIFAPGVDPLFQIGAVTERWDSRRPLAPQLAAALKSTSGVVENRDQLGLERKGRLQAAPIARQVATEALRHA